jgi:hypothetical protein
VEKTLFNKDLRVAKGSTSYKLLSKFVGVSYVTLSNWFNREEMDDVKRMRVLKGIAALEKMKGEGNIE